MRLLALDISTVTGWARWRPGLARPASGAIRFPADLGARADEFEQWLIGKLIADEIEALAIEALVPEHKNTNLDALRWLYGANLAVHKICRRRKLPLKEIAVSTWRSSFLGVTRAPKNIVKGKRSEWMKEKCKETCELRGWPAKDHNQADALGILDHFRSTLMPDHAVAASPLFSGVAQVGR